MSIKKKMANFFYFAIAFLLARTCSYSRLNQKKLIFEEVVLVVIKQKEDWKK
jgi:hypothetical protein